jgi:phage terminase large subunit-like protein
MKLALSRIRERIEDLEEERAANCVTGDPSRFQWYDPSCPCGLPAGECREHPRARENQRPPSGDWATWLLLMGRGSGKSRSGAEWVRALAESNVRHRIALVGSTAADVRDVMVEGESGILAVCPPWNRPKYEPSKRRLTWRNGTVATTFSAEEPDRLRGPSHSAAWCDEVAAWANQATWDMMMFGLRLGEDPRVCCTTTPKPTKLVKTLVADCGTTISRGSSYQNKLHLAPTFFNKLIATYEGTRLGQQEIHAELLEVSEGAWFASFDPAKHVTDLAEYDSSLPVHLAIDAGTSRTTAACWFQIRPSGPHTFRVTVFGDYCVAGLFSEANAKAIKARSAELPNRGRLDTVRIDPASSAQTGIGVSAYSYYESVFGSRILSRSPHHMVTDGLDQMEVLLDHGDLLLHPRATHTKGAFLNYVRASRGGEFLNEPAADQSPWEDSMDALRYGIRSRFPEGRVQQSKFRTVNVRSLI